MVEHRNAESEGSISHRNSEFFSLALTSTRQKISSSKIFISKWVVPSLQSFSVQEFLKEFEGIIQINKFLCIIFC